MSGGLPERENDVEHLMLALMEQARGASNIVTIRPGLVVAFERNNATNKTLRDQGITVKEWPDSYLDLLGAPSVPPHPYGGSLLETRALATPFFHRL
jgi:hypothetical protein